MTPAQITPKTPAEALPRPAGELDDLASYYDTPRHLDRDGTRPVGRSPTHEDRSGRTAPGPTPPTAPTIRSVIAAIVSRVLSNASTARPTAAIELDPGQLASAISGQPRVLAGPMYSVVHSPIFDFKPI